MKKFAIISAIVLVGSATAFAAGSLNVPWFVDNAPDNIDAAQPVGSVQGFIALHNNTATAIEATIVYKGNDGADRTPAGVTSFSIPGDSTVAFRPVASGEAPANSESALAATIPNIEAGKSNGSATISWSTGTATDIQGRYQEVVKGLQGSSIGMYLLPAGL